jgi:hypothetical protein
MFKKFRMTILSGAVLAVLALSAIGCDTLPTALAFLQPTSTPTPTDTPTPAPTSAPQAAATPAAPSARTPRRAKAAQTIQALLKNTGLRGGVVTSNDGSTLGLKLGKATVQIQTSANVIVVVPGKTNATLSDIAVGDRVIADVTGNSASSAASMVLDIPASYKASNVMLGAVMPNKNGSLMVRARGGTHAVTTDASTVIVDISGGQPALGTLSDLTPASAVLVIGSSSGSAFNAQVIVLVDKNVRDLLNQVRKNLATPTPTPGS